MPNTPKNSSEPPVKPDPIQEPEIDPRYLPPIYDLADPVDFYTKVDNFLHPDKPRDNFLSTKKCRNCS